MFALLLILLALFLGGTGYLLHVRAIHRSRIDPLERNVRTLKMLAAERPEPRRMRGEFYLNQFMTTFPLRQAEAMAEFLSTFYLAGPLIAGADLQVRESGISLRFLVSWKPDARADLSLRLQNRMRENPSIIRMDCCPGGQVCLRGHVEVP